VPGALAPQLDLAVRRGTSGFRHFLRPSPHQSMSFAGTGPTELGDGAIRSAS